MHPRRKPSLALLVAISALTTLPMTWLRSEMRLLAQVTAEPTPTFTQPASIAADTTLSIDGAPSMAGINQSLKESFEQRYPGARVTLSVSSDDQALTALRNGSIDLAALGRALSEAEDDPSLTSIPVTREKIAIIVGRDNPFRGDLTFGDFAGIFRGDITNWSQVGGPNVPIRFVDRPATSDTRLALADYEIFQDRPFETGPTADPVEVDDTAAVVRALGSDGISYAIASEVINQDAVRPLSMHNTLPSDPRYPYSQPRNYIYRGEPSLPIEAFLGFATNAEGQAAIAEAKQTASANVTVGANRLPGGVALAPDGRFMVRGTEDGQIQWLDAEGNPTGITIADAHRGAVSAVVISPNGQTVITSGADGTIRRWDRNGASLGTPLTSQGGPILALALNPDGTILTSGHADGTVERWAVASGQSVGDPITAHSGPVQAIHFPAGGQALLTGSGDGTLRFWNADGTLASQVNDAHGNGVTAITSTPDGQVITTTGGDGTLRQWDRSTLQPRGEAIQAHGNAVSAVAYTPDGSTLASAGADSTLQLWGVDGTPQLQGPVQLAAPAASLGFTPEGQLLVGSSDRTVQRRDRQGALVTATDPTQPATDLGDLRDRIRNLPPSTWWALGVIPLLLVGAGLVGAMLGIKGKDPEADPEAEDGRLVPRPGLGPGLGINFSGVDRLPTVNDPLPPGGSDWPPEAGLVPGGNYAVSPSPSKLEQARTNLAEGRQLMREGRYDIALIYFNQAIEATEIERSKAEATGLPAPGTNAIAAQAQAQRGNALALLGQVNDAMDSYNAALQIDSSVTDAWVGKGRLLSTMGRYDEAIFCFDSALEIDQSAGEAWLGKGQALLQLGRHSEAQTALARASALGIAVSGLGGATLIPGYPAGAGVPEVGGPEVGGPEVGGPEYRPFPDYDPDVPLDLQQMVQGLPSADTDRTSHNPGDYDVPPALAAEAARLPDQAETSAPVGVSGSSGGAMVITPGPIPSENGPPAPSANQPISPGPIPSGPISPGPISPGPIPSGPITPGPITPEPIAPSPIAPSPLEDELLSQVHLTAATDLDAALQGLPIEANGGVTSVPPLRPAPVPVPPPVPLEPGDYIPPPPEVTASAAPPGLEGLPPEVIAALASIPPGSPDSFGPITVSADSVPTPTTPTQASWVKLSVDHSVDHNGGRFYAVWQLDEGDRARAKDQGGETLALRLYDVTGHPTSAPLPTAVAEQRCRDDFAQDWYLSIPQWDRIYVVEVGYLGTGGDWAAIAQSSEVAAITPA